MSTSDHVEATSASRQTTTSRLKEKAIEEFRMFWVIAIYLAVMLSAFASYRRLVLSESGISYFHYGTAVIEALILAKVILIGKALRLGHRLEDSRLIVSVLFKALVFGIFMAIFAVLEDVIEGLVHRDTWDQITNRLLSVGRSEILARTVIGIVTLVPFFAFWEADRVIGDHKLFNLFFRKRAA